MPVTARARTVVFVGLVAACGWLLAAWRQAALAAEKPSQAPQLVVCPNCRLRKLGEALAAAAPGARVIVQAGLYAEGTVTVNKPVEITGQGYPVIDGLGRGDVIRVTANDVTIRALWVRNSGSSAMGDPAAIKAVGVSRCLIEDNRVSDSLFGIRLDKGSDCVVRHNELRGGATSASYSGNAIHLWNSQRVVVEGNRARGWRDGLYFEFTRGLRVQGNLSENNLRYGLHTMYSSDNRYRQNVLRANQGGVVLMYSRQLTVLDNRSERHWGAACYGALLKDLDASRFEHNRFAGNSVALVADNANGNVVAANDFVQNGFALRILASSSDNRFSGNAFAANAFDVITNGTRSDNLFAANYWDRYRGYDLDHDGIGDVPYYPVSLFALLLGEYPQAILLLRSPLVSLLDLAERGIPLLTPQALSDTRPLMERPRWSKSSD